MADDANRDEVDKCKRIAETALGTGDTEKAIRFLQKAKRMSPGDASIDELLARAESGPAGGSRPASSPTESNAGSATNGASSGPRFRPAASGASNSAPSSGAGATRVGKDGRSYTTEQMQLVQRILRTKDYYDILEVPREAANEDSVKRAYKKLALKLHPDKNKAPGAEEAFKKLSKAVQCLTDEEKKHVYDRYGDEERIPQQQRHHYQQDFMTPEDLFAAFFGGGAFQTGGHQHTGQHGEGGQAQRQNFLQLLPVLMLIILTLASNFASNSGSSSRFSFTATSQYKHERSTATLEVSYYVTDDFTDHYPEGTKALAEFERQVEIYHVRNLHSECDYQEKTMYKKVVIAKRKGNQEELQKARRHPRPACKDIEEIKRTHSNIYRAAMYMVY